MDFGHCFYSSCLTHSPFVHAFGNSPSRLFRYVLSGITLFFSICYRPTITWGSYLSLLSSLRRIYLERPLPADLIGKFFRYYLASPCGLLYLFRFFFRRRWIVFHLARSCPSLCWWGGGVPRGTRLFPAFTRFDPSGILLIEYIIRAIPNSRTVSWTFSTVALFPSSGISLSPSVGGCACSL